MTFPRKTAAVLAFAVAFALAIALTTFLQMRLRGDVPPNPPIAAPPARIENAPVAFRVEQAVVDFARKQSYTTLVIEPRAGEPVPERVWVWTTYYEPPADAPHAKQQWRKWTSEPTEVSIGDKRRIQFVAACAVCGERRAGKPTFYVRVHLAPDAPAHASVEAASDDFNLADVTPVVVQGLDRNTR